MARRACGGGKKSGASDLNEPIGAVRSCAGSLVRNTGREVVQPRSRGRPPKDTRERFDHRVETRARFLKRHRESSRELLPPDRGSPRAGARCPGSPCPRSASGRSGSASPASAGRPETGSTPSGRLRGVRRAGRGGGPRRSGGSGVAVRPDRRGPLPPGRGPVGERGPLTNPRGDRVAGVRRPRRALRGTRLAPPAARGRTFVRRRVRVPRLGASAVERRARVVGRASPGSSQLGGATTTVFTGGAGGRGGGGSSRCRRKPTIRVHASSARTRS